MIPINIDHKNIAIFREIFNWCEVPEISTETVPELAQMIGINLNSDEILCHTSWFQYRDYQIMSVKGQHIFHIKRLWEAGSIKEILGLELARIFDPDLAIKNYVFGLFTTRFLHRPVPFVLTTWNPGIPISKEQSLDFPFQMGQQYEFNRWLSLYDCHPRHYYLEPDNIISRIDYGLAFSKLNKRYEGFADIWPKNLFGHPEFMRGIKIENQKLHIRAEIMQDRIFELLNKIGELKLDDYVSLRGYRERQKIIDYWRSENILDDCNLSFHQRFSFLHSPIQSCSDSSDHVESK